MAVRHEGTQFRSQREQALHYFSRPHQRVPRSPIDGPAAWRGVDMARRHDWVHVLLPGEIEAIRRAFAHAAATNRETRELVAADFPLPDLAPLLRRVRSEVSRGRGLFLLRGLPVSEWNAAQAERFFWCLGLHLGIPGAQNPQGDLVGHVRDTLDPLDQAGGRYYKTRRHIEFHCDAADAVGLLCLRKAKSGGASRIVSSVSVYNEMLRRHPDQVGRLFRPYMLDTHGEGGVDAFPVVPCRYSNGRLQTTYHSDYFRSAGSHPGVPPLSDADLAVLDSYERIANEEGMYLEMDLEPGDVQLISNHTVLHARTAYEDDEDPALRRHLLRLWLSFDEPLSVADRLRKKRELLRLLLGVARQRRPAAGRAGGVQAT